MRYLHIVTLRGDDYYGFEAITYPERSGVSLGWPRPSKGLEYLARWVTGDENEFYPGEGKPFCFPGSDATYTDDDYFMVWAPLYGIASLYRVIDTEANCAACGEGAEWCRGHGPIADPRGHAILLNHDAGEHGECDPYGCDERKMD